ncbi:CocE/NonD family hydrolase [Rheinheimera maricola]|uniref:CocE/NonD family hydrolase n=1 Tax=Rheinheimera maricola TaxID=2793282 RepID=A0ABS7X3E3_9GAMM|nr:CocE/NonD family hydrolase [Rheinheimera maricola]MBZ9610081.1 CocE/NonD family hydrolase [Rheinheimera maricola]
MKKFLILLVLLITAGQARAELDTNLGLGTEYDVKDKILIQTRDGAEISAIVVKKKGNSLPLPTIFQFTIYVRDDKNGRDINSLKKAVDNGYVGVIAYSRGKRHSSDNVFPYETDGKDAYDVINWISKQTWSNGKVGMYGGSYNGFTQWAATKQLNPSLKTIVPYVANRPGMGLPMESNIFINPNYEWAFYVTNNKRLDNVVGNDRARFRKMQNIWWETGRPYRELDEIDGQPNKFFQKWLLHPSYDEYWQSMVPYKEEFANIDIPVLSVDGYYNDSQVSGLYYLRQHLKYNPNAQHYLIIGPYDHFGAQRGGQSNMRGLAIDDNALIDLNKITYEWFDYILKEGVKPSFLKDKVNYYVMGENVWRSAPTIESMSNSTLQLFLTEKEDFVSKFYKLDSRRPAKEDYLQQEVDFSDRKISNNDYYPDPIIRDQIDTENGYVFVSDTFNNETIVNGSFSGELVVSINKKDVDLGITLYELLPNGKYFHLSYNIFRASYSNDPSKRNLLTPGKKEKLKFYDSRLISRKMEKGSRLVVYVNVNKNPFSQINYGTGTDVSDESINDAEEELIINWYNESFINVPVLKKSVKNLNG